MVQEVLAANVTDADAPAEEANVDRDLSSCVLNQENTGRKPGQQSILPQSTRFFCRGTFVQF